MRIWGLRLFLATLLAGIAAAALRMADWRGYFDLRSAIEAVANDNTVIKFLISGLGAFWQHRLDSFIDAHPGATALVGLWAPALGLVLFMVRNDRVYAPAVNTTAATTEGFVIEAPRQPPLRESLPANEVTSDFEMALAALKSDSVITDEEIRGLVSRALKTAPEGPQFEYLLPVFEEVGARQENRQLWVEAIQIIETGVSGRFNITSESTRQALRSAEPVKAASTALGIMDVAYRRHERAKLDWRESGNGDGILDALSDMIRANRKSMTVPSTFALFWLTSARSMSVEPVCALRDADLDALKALLANSLSHKLAVFRGGYILGKHYGGQIDSSVWLDWGQLVDTGSRPPDKPAVIPAAIVPGELREIALARLSEPGLAIEASKGLAVLALRLGSLPATAVDALLAICTDDAVEIEFFEEIAIRAASVGGDEATSLLARTFRNGGPRIRLRAFLALASMSAARAVRPDGVDQVTVDTDTVDFDAALSRLEASTNG